MARGFEGYYTTPLFTPGTKGLDEATKTTIPLRSKAISAEQLFEINISMRVTNS
jgi:hypothetical protein